MNKFMKILAVMSVVFLSACEPDAEQSKALQDMLPDGCVANYLDQRYGDIRRVLVVICDGRTTTSTTWMETSGKTTATYATLVIE